MSGRKTHGLPKEKLSVAIVGARGYSGLELARLLLRHPNFHLSAVSANSAFELYDELLDDRAKAVPFMPLEQLLQMSPAPSTVFLATPAEISLELAPNFLARGADVIDLSGAFRLKRGGAAAYKTWYGMTHEREDLLAMAEYGLRPWLNDEGDRSSGRPRLISNPGCYATACLMALIPLIRLGVIEPSQIVIDAKSGTTGGGRKASEDLLFSEVADDCRPYKVGTHQHTPEIVEGLRAFAGFPEDVKFTPAFTTHLLPVRRGIIASIYASAAADRAGQTDDELECAVAGAFAEFYRGYPLVRFGRIGEKATKAKLSLRSVAGTPYTNLAYAVKDGRIYLFSLLDNLLKGAASQAVENLNIINQLPVETGLCSSDVSEVI